MKKPVSVLFSYSLVALAAAYTSFLLIYILVVLLAIENRTSLFSPSIAWRDTQTTPIAYCCSRANWERSWLSSSLSLAQVLLSSDHTEFLFLGEAIKSLVLSTCSSQRRLSAYIDTEHLGRRLRIYRSHNMRDLGGGRRERVREGDTVKQTRRKVYFGMKVH